MLNENFNKEVNLPYKLVPTEAPLTRAIASLPKIDLHRHLTGSITADLAVSIAKNHGVYLPTYNSGNLHAILYGKNRVKNLREYFLPWPVLDKLFVSKEAIFEIITNAVKDASSDNVVYTEFRISPKHFFRRKDFSFEKYIETIACAAQLAEVEYKTTVRFVLGVSRHSFIRIPTHERNYLFDRMINGLTSVRPKYFVGVDISGDEEASNGSGFEYFFERAREEGFGVTAHAGEAGPAENVERAVRNFGATRIGHGLTATRTPELLSWLSERKCLFELCPTSNILLGIIPNLFYLPINQLSSYGVSYAICTDNPARCKTTLTKEWSNVASTFKLSIEDIRTAMYTALEHSFAPDKIKQLLQSKLDHHKTVTVRDKSLDKPN